MARARRGRLRVFFGMAPGVGKTYAMLEAAQRMGQQGHDVVVGLVETHGRRETEQMLLGLDLLPRRSVEYRGTTLQEFDLDGALRRRPEILLLDELAHTNAPASRFEKRWQDVKACLDAGIGVWTTLNVQHLDSLNDVVARITGVTVRETVPDAVVEEADEIEVVDLPPDALLERLRAGKVYVPEVAASARDAFFRVGNLTALRQLVLRRAAEWVDRQMSRAKRGQGVRAAWPAAQRILVCVGPSPQAPKLLRAARRMAAGLRADLLAVHVEPPPPHTLPDADRERVLETLRLAGTLGAEPISLPCPAGGRAVDELLTFARNRDVDTIVIGRTERPRWLAALMGSFADEVVRRSGEISVTILPGDAEESPDPESRARPAAAAPGAPAFAGAPPGADPFATPLLPLHHRLLGAAAIVAAGCGLSWLIYDPRDLSDESMILLAAIVVAAWRFGRRAGVAAALLSVLSLNFFFTPPRFTLNVDDPRAFITFAVMLAVGLLVGTLTARTRDQADQARARERRTAALNALSRRLAMARDAQEVAAATAQATAENFHADAVLLRLDAGRLEVMASAGNPDWLDERERGVARWTLDHGRLAGAGTGVLPGGSGRFVSLEAPQGRMGCLGVRARSGALVLDTPSAMLLESFAAAAAMALERVSLIETRHSAQVAAESERLRSALLASVSHDLRTPLAGIAGAASALLLPDPAGAETQRELAQSILDEATRLGDLIANLVFATRLQTGIDLRREWTTVEELVGAGLARHRQALAARPFRLTVAEDLPLLRVDTALVPQVIHNLVENALRYTDDATPMSLAAWRDEDRVVIRIADEGPGLAAGEESMVFERFVRGRSARHGSAGGLGLGLTIARGVVEAHGGRIWAEPNQPRGVAFLFQLPVEEPQPPMPTERDA